MTAFLLAFESDFRLFFSGKTESGGGGESQYLEFSN
jgi:hypothetical protein